MFRLKRKFNNKQIYSQPTYGPQTYGSPTYNNFFSSFISKTTQNCLIDRPIPITFSEKSMGYLNVINGTFPNSEIIISVGGIYKIYYSIQCTSNVENSYLDVFPVINNRFIENSKRRIYLNSNKLSIINSEHFITFNPNDIFQLNIISNNVTCQIKSEEGSQNTPNIPSIILNIIKVY